MSDTTSVSGGGMVTRAWSTNSFPILVVPVSAGVYLARKAKLQKSFTRVLKRLRRPLLSRYDEAATDLILADSVRGFEAASASCGGWSAERCSWESSSRRPSAQIWNPSSHSVYRNPLSIHERLWYLNDISA